MPDEIDLAVSQKDLYGDLGGPLSSLPDKKGDDVYPSFHYSGPKELDLPDSGEMTICFKKSSETSKVRRDGSHWYECCIEVQSIKDVDDDEPESPTRRDTSAGDALDKIRDTVMAARGEGNSSY